MAASIILKTEKELLLESAEFKKLLFQIKKKEFWRDHFLRHNFNLNAELFNWDYWRGVPCLTKEEFSKGLKLRLRGAAEDMKASIYNYLLRVTSGTTGGEPSLFLHYISEADKTIEDLSRGIRLWQPHHIGLRWALTGILLNKKNETGKHQFLVIDPYKINESMRQALVDFGAQSVNGLSSSIVKFASTFSSNQELASSIEKVIFGGDFIGRTHYEIIRNFFTKVDETMIVSDYIMAECGRMGAFCYYLKRKHGDYTAYHPAVRNGLVEIIDPDENGYGEIVVTKIKPNEAAIIRYKTGDMGKAIKEKCKCGKEWALMLIGRSNFDYVKCAGTLILRAELERVFNGLRKYVLDWRAEASEKVIDGTVIGKLKIKIIPSLEGRGLKEALIDKISDSTFLTPNKTLKDLVLEKKFLPLNLEFINNFPETQKAVPLRKL